MLVESNLPGAAAHILQCRDLSELPDGGPSTTEMVNVLRQRGHYRVFTIPKSNGSERIIEDPSAATRVVLEGIRQRWRELELDKSLSRHAVGFRPAKSVMDASSVVRARTSHGTRAVKVAWVFTQDLKDAFHSVTERQVRNMLRQDMGFTGFPLHLATRAMTRRGRLAVGSPASPEFLNLHLREMDRDLAALAKRHGVTYARYADDLTFYGEASHLTDKGRRKRTKRSWWTWFAKQARRIIEGAGMTPHPGKSSLTKIEGPKAAPAAEVLGHTVRAGGRTAPTRKTKRRARAARHRFTRAGFAPLKPWDTGREHLALVAPDLRVTLQEAQGLLAWHFLTRGFKTRRQKPPRAGPPRRA